MPPKILDAAAAAQLGAGERISCCAQGMEELADLSSLATTKRLDLAGNKIAALASFVPPPALKHLDLKANALSCFSLSLASLRVLDLSSNRLAGTFHLAGLPALAALILSENKLTGLTGLGSAPELATLVIKHNAFVDLAPALAKGAAKALTKLSAAHNKLTALDVTPCPALAELRAGHNDLSALPTGLGARLRVLDVGGNPRLGGRAAGKKGLAAAVAPLAGKPWLRAVTLRGTALGGCDGIKDALAAVLPDLQILDDKRVAGRGADGALPPPPPPASPSHVKKVKFERKLKEKVEEKKAKVKEKKEKVKEKKAETAAVGRLASEEGLGAAGEDEAPGPAPPAAALPLPLADPTPHGQAAVKVLPGARPSKKGGKGGAAAALLIAGRDEMEVGGWGAMLRRAVTALDPRALLPHTRRGLLLEAGACTSISTLFAPIQRGGGSVSATRLAPLASAPLRGFAGTAGGGGSSSSDDDDTDDEAGPSGSQAAKKAGKGRRAAAGTPAKPPRGAQAGAAAAPGGGEAAAGEEDGAAPFASVLAGGSRIEAMLHEMETSNRTRARFIMQRILDGKEASAFPRLPTDDPAADAEAEAAEAAFLGRFRTRVVDVTRSSKGSNTGSVSRFSAMVVAGNGAGVLGLGTGRAAEVADAVRKATVAALGGASLFFVPRHARTTVLAPSTAWYGSVKASVFPLPTGRGIRAGPLAAGVCRLAGLADVGVKLHGARTPRNAVKALIKALEGGATLAGAAREAAAAGGVPGGARVRVRELVSAGVGGPGQRKVRRVGGVGGAWFK